MKKKLISVLTVVVLSLSLASCAVEKENIIHNDEIVEAPETPQQPLIIKSRDKSPQEKNPTGVYEGTITITGPGVEDICYEGIIMIQMDGDKIRIVSTDSIRSNFSNLF